MRRQTATATPIVCHWSVIPGPGHNGRPSQARVWICEYPYRTMRTTGPCGDCEDCPLWRQLTRQTAPQRVM